MSAFCRVIALASCLAFGTFANASEVASSPAGAPSALIGKYCEKCHNTDDWAGGIAFDTMTFDHLADDAETWEKAVRKLRGGLMPPPGNPRPAHAEVVSTIGWLEKNLDAAEASHPFAGSVTIHRLNRKEYANAVRDLLGVHVDASTLLPADDVHDGFDNVAASLQVSPAFLDQYLEAARVVALQAVGNPRARPVAVIYGPPGDMKAYGDISGVEKRGIAGAGTQRFHRDGFPFGTRGGMSVEHDFPADGEYSLTIGELAAGRLVPNMEYENTVVALLDGREFFRTTIGGAADLKSIDQGQDPAANEINKRLRDIRFHATAGAHRVIVTFLERSLAESDERLRTVAAVGGQERELAIHAFELRGPLATSGVSDFESREKIFTCRPHQQSEEDACASQIVSSLARKAFRRPVRPVEVQRLLSFYRTGRAAGDFDRGIRDALSAILASPYFLYRTESARGAGPDGTRTLTDLELASRLSFFLWSSVPDEELLALATKGVLHEPATLQHQVERMLADERSESLVTSFAFQWLNLAKLDEIVPNPALFPYASGQLDPRPLFREELRLFIDSVFRGSGSVVDLLTSDQTFLNERLALLYGIRDVQGDRFRPVRLHDSARFGLLGKGAVLMLTAYPDRTAPVLRGAWILDRLMGTPPAAPPPNVGTLKQPEPGAKALTMRERVALHSSNPTCHGCHGILDPLGFALENFDAVGQYRVRDVNTHTVVDSSGVLPDGTKLDGPDDLRRALVANSEQFVQALTERLFTFALGRSLDYRDMPAVRAMVRNAAAGDYRFSAIVMQIVSSDAFRKRAVTSPPQLSASASAVP
jgi:hypothetical protein